MTKTKVGVPIPKQNDNPYIVRVEAYWRDHMNNFEPSSKIMEFKGVDRADVYEYIKYYSLKFGLCDVVHKGEGYGEATDEPDMSDPEVQKSIAEAIKDETL